ncbi:MAG: GNAT family N-acetyltransferase [Chloroflexi bacterium]|nr:GNAT family N-acetyltransferase [Chloroflexota bacterium]
MDIQPVTLVGRFIRLEPLSLDHALPLWEMGNEPGIWAYMPYGVIDSPVKMRGWVEEMLRRQSKGTDLPFAIVDTASGWPIGATRSMTIERAHRSLEIGGTWLGASFRGTLANTESKYLLLQHAFESLECIRVQFRTDLRNERSQKALERLGAVREAVLRKYTIMPDGYQRSSVFYSVIDDEWPQMKARLEEMLNAEYGIRNGKNPRGE